MGNDHSTAPKRATSYTKAGKKWRIPSRKYISKRERQEQDSCASLDLGITQLESPAMSWNCHHRLADIRANLIRHRLHANKLQSDLSSKQQENLSAELESITNCISQTIHGITHNYVDGVANEKALLDYWMNRNGRDAQHSADSQGIGVIVFEIAAMDKIHETLGWKSGDRIIVETGKKIAEYCTWYSQDYHVKFKLFHPDFALNEFIVVSTCTDDQVIADFCDCILVDVARSVKCFFQQTVVWAGYATNAHNAAASDSSTSRGKATENNQSSAGLEIEDVRYNFRSWYEKAKYAIRDAMKLSSFTDNNSDRIRKWLSREQRLSKGKKVLKLIESMDNASSDDDAVLESIEHQMKSGADLNFVDANTFQTPFFAAIARKNISMMHYLLKFDFNVDHQDRCGRTALVQAMNAQLSESVCCELALRLKFPNVPDQDNVTPFVRALNCGYFKVMDILSGKGAMDYKNWIISCCMKDQHIILTDMVRYNGISFAAKLDHIGRSILHYAVLHQAYRIMKVCLNNRYIHADTVDNNGWSPLHYAAAKNYCKAIELLVDADANLRLRTEEQFLPISIAKKFNKTDAVRLLSRYARASGNSRLGKEWRLSLSMESRSVDTLKITPRSSGSDHEDEFDENGSRDSETEDEDDDEKQWDKENCDANVMIGRSRGNSDSQSAESRSKVQSQQSSSENQYKLYQAHKKVSKVSTIDEDELSKKILDDGRDSSRYYSETDCSDSNATRITHSSELEQQSSAAHSVSDAWSAGSYGMGDIGQGIKGLDRIEMEILPTFTPDSLL